MNSQFIFCYEFTTIKLLPSLIHKTHSHFYEREAVYFSFLYSKVYCTFTITELMPKQFPHTLESNDLFQRLTINTKCRSTGLVRSIQRSETSISSNCCIKCLCLQTSVERMRSSISPTISSRSASEK